jgi:hypothetical protein
MNRARDRTRAEVAKKLVDGLPVATMDDGTMEVHQLVESSGHYMKKSSLTLSRSAPKRLTKLSRMRLKEFASENEADTERRRPAGIVG